MHQNCTFSRQIWLFLKVHLKFYSRAPNWTFSERARQNSHSAQGSLGTCSEHPIPLVCSLFCYLYARTAAVEVGASLEPAPSLWALCTRRSSAFAFQPMIMSRHRFGWHLLSRTPWEQSCGEEICSGLANSCYAPAVAALHTWHRCSSVSAMHGSF